VAPSSSKSKTGLLPAVLLSDLMAKTSPMRVAPSSLISVSQMLPHRSLLESVWLGSPISMQLST
jgi:hypothetical protein